MKHHVYFERLFEAVRPSRGLLSPFNLDVLEDVDTSEPYFDGTLYKKVIKPSSQRPLNYVNTIERAITRLVMPEIRSEIKGFGGFGFDEGGNFYADYYDGTQSIFNDSVNKGETNFSKARHIVMKIESISGKLLGTVVDEYGGEEAYLIKTRNQDAQNRHSSSAAIYALLSYIIARHEKGYETSCSSIIYNHYRDIVAGYSSADMGSCIRAMRALDADIYTLFQYPGETASVFGWLPVNPEDYNYSDLEKLDISSIGKLKNVKGDSSILNGGAVPTGTSTIKVKKRLKTVKEYISDDTYSLGAILSDEEQALVPIGFDDFMPSEITLDVASEIKASMSDPTPARNFLWTGETGCGKSTESQMLARLLGLPYRSMNLSSDKLSSDILVSCLPNHQKLSTKELNNLMDRFPSSDFIAINPDGAYFEITGVKKSEATEADVNIAKTEKIFQYMKKANDFIYVDSPFVESFRYGGVVELQEVNSCKAAILKSLNEALDDLNIIHLPTGEIVRRHKNCIVVVTANVGQGYEGINNFSNDFIARFHQADVFELPDDTTLIKRVVDRSGYTDEQIIRKMIKVMHAIQRVLLETKGDYGSCSPRGLIAWARKTKNCNDPYFAGCKTIVGLSTQDPEIRIELLHALETEFVPSI